MKTKEDILKEQNITGKCKFYNSDLVEMDREDIKYAMNEYALELCIEFGKWLKHLDNGHEHYDPETKILSSSIGFSPSECFMDDLKSVEELFLEFTKYRQNEPTTL